MPDYDENAIAEYHARRQKYIDLGYNPYESMEYIVSLMEPIEGTVLEVGTGRGLTAVTVARHTTLTTVDIDEELIDFAEDFAKSEGMYDRIQFFKRDISSDPLPDGSYDNVISTHAFHHFDDPVKMSNILCSVAKKKILIADFSKNGFKIVDTLHRNEGHEGHDSGTVDISVAGDVMRENGFIVKRHEDDTVIVFIGTKPSA